MAADRSPQAFVVWIVVLVSVSAAVVAQVAVSPPPPREQGPQPPIERRIPIGNSTLSGTVLTAEGRPIKGARVVVTGQIPQNMGTSPGASGAAAAAARGTSGSPVVTAGVIGGIPGAIPVAGGMSPGNMTRGGLTPPSVSRSTMTDQSGMFSFPRLPAGQYSVAVQHGQFLPMNYGQRRQGGPGTFLPLADGQELTLKIPLLRGGVIAGRIIGPDGDAIPSAQVRAWRYSMSSGVRRLQGSGFANADDRGNYRMHGLQPGEYLVAATPANLDMMGNPAMAQYDVIERAIATAQAIPPASAGLTPTVSVQVPVQQPGPYMAPPGYLPTFAPSAVTPSDATTISVAGNEERSGVDIFVRLVQASSIRGQVHMQPDPAVSVQLTLIGEDTTIDASESASTRPDQAGNFSFRTVRPGKYTVMAVTVPAPQLTPPAPPAPGQPYIPPTLTDAQKLWGRAPVTVSGEPVVNVNLSLKPGRTISGVVIFETQRPVDLTRSRLTVALTPAPSSQTFFFGQTPQAQVGPDGQFTLTGVVPGRYVIRVNGGGDAKSSMVAGQDTLDFPVEFTGETDVTGAVLTVTDSLGELSGTLTDASGKPALDYSILAASTDSRFWTPGSRRIAVARPGLDGRYTFRSLPPGTYSVCAVTDFEQGTQYDPEFLKTVAAASVTVTIAEGGKVQQDLRVK